MRVERVPAKIACLQAHDDSALRDRGSRPSAPSSGEPNARRALSQFVLGLAELRCGHDTEVEKALAIAWEKRGEEPPFFAGPIRLIGAMIPFHRGSEEALTLFASPATPAPSTWDEGRERPVLTNLGRVTYLPEAAAEKVRAQLEATRGKKPKSLGAIA